MVINNRSKIDLTEIHKETLIERIFKFLAILMVIIFPIALVFCFRVVKQYKRAVVLRFGRVRCDSPAGPGIIWVVPCTDNVVFIDLRTQSFNLAPQEILTKDSVTVHVDAVVYFHVTNPLSSLLNVQSHKKATELLSVSFLRNILGQYTLSELLSNRVLISDACRKIIDKGTVAWGVEVERVEIKDVILPFELQKAMAAEAEGARIAKAKIIEAEGEIKAAENLKEAAKLMMENPKAMLTILKVLFYKMHTPNENDENVRLHQESQHPSFSASPIDLEKCSPRSHRPRLQVNKGKDKLIEKFLIFLSILLVIIAFPLSLICIFVISRQFERAIILRNGKVHKNRAFGPGLLFYLPCVDSVKFIDLRTFCYEVPPQEALTRDSLTVSVDAVVFYKVFEPVWAVINVTNYRIATQFLASTTLRYALGTTKLSDLLINRPVISQQVLELMKNITKEWGVEVVKVEIKDIRLPLQLQKAMAAEAESTRLANAKIIVAKSEIETARNLQLATSILMDNPMCMQVIISTHICLTAVLLLARWSNSSIV
ncbi:unnamed protein product [Leptosia nina]|uniref:Band 7 domain-containing protein n=1 Tax=Leptosia nina TaxID=320188 RepID=A0AAV1JZG2_9NEOP